MRRRRVSYLIIFIPVFMAATAYAQVMFADVTNGIAKCLIVINQERKSLEKSTGGPHATRNHGQNLCPPKS